MNQTDANANASEHQKLIDHIKTEMGEGGPRVINETESEITFRTLAHKERSIKLLSDRVDYEPTDTEHKTVDGWDYVDVTFEPA